MRLPAVFMSKVCSLAVAAAAILLAGCYDPEARETPGEKSEWSALQAVELKNRSMAIATPAVYVVGQHEVLGVRGASGENIWVLLKPASPPYYKQMPNGSYEVPRELVEKLIQEHRVSYTVEQVLSSHTSTK